MATAFAGWYELHGRPCRSGFAVSGTGGPSGFPQAQRTRGTPRSSTMTAVPAWRTAWYSVPLPLR